MQMKNSLLQLENQHNLLVEEKNLNELKVDNRQGDQDHLLFKNQALEKQIEAISDALSNCESSIE